jgi:Uma2 family endonuclease
MTMNTTVISRDVTIAGRIRAGVRRNLWTYEAYAAATDEDERTELIDGEVRVVPSPLTIHQDIALSVAATLRTHVRRYRLGRVLIAPTDVALAPGQTLVPDVLFVASARAEIITATHVVGPPDLVVEVLSPGTAANDLPGGRKFALYAQAGVPHYWVIDPDNVELRVFTLDAAGVYVETGSYRGDETYEPPLFPGLTLRPADWDQVP